MQLEIIENSNIVSAQDYYPYGEILRSYTLGSGANNKYYFTEKERDPETNYDYFGARYYDSELARWLQVDPLNSERPGLTPYNYCQSKPLARIDPDGRIDLEALMNNSFKALVGVFGGIKSVEIMIGSAGGTFISAGKFTPVAIPAFITGAVLFNASVLTAIDGFSGIGTAIQTPNGMKAEDFSSIKSIVKGLGGNEMTQETASLLVSIMGMKDVGKFDDGIMYAISVLQAADATTEDIINFLNTLTENTNNENSNEKNVNTKEENK